MSSNDEYIFHGSSSQDDSSKLIKLDECEERIAHQNRSFDRIIEDVVIQIPTLSIQPTNHNARAKRRHIERIREVGHANLFKLYFSIFPEDVFHRRFRMRKHVFERIMEKLSSISYFQQKCDATGRLGMSLIKKCTAVIRVLAYGTSPDVHDECMRMSAQVIRESVTQFVDGVIANFGDEYLRSPTEEDMARLLHIGEQRGFPGMMDSIDCMHWEWKNCPTAWAGQYQGKSGKLTIILEAVASQDLWTWHAFLGSPCTHNDINVLEKSPVLSNTLEGRAPKISYVVNGKERDMGYTRSGQHLSNPLSLLLFIKNKLFAKHQELLEKWCTTSSFCIYQESVLSVGSSCHGKNYDCLYHPP